MWTDKHRTHSQTHSHRISYFKDFESVRSYDERIRKQDQWYHSGIRYILERILGDLRQRLSRQSATESAVGD
jgi:hypothetical protein